MKQLVVVNGTNALGVSAADQARIRPITEMVEHLTRGTTRAIDAMLVVVEPGRRSLRLARTIERLAQQLSIRRAYYVANKVADDDQEALLRRLLADRPLLGVVRACQAIARAGLLDQAADQASPELVAVAARVVERLEAEAAGE